MNCLYITLFFNIVAGIALEPASAAPSHRSLPPALWTTSWLLAPHHLRRTFPQRGVSLGEETSGNVSFPVTMESRNQTLTFCVDKSYDGTHLAFGGTWDRRCHFKHVSLKLRWFYHCQTSTAHRYRIKVDGSVAIISIKTFLSAYTWCIFTFRTRFVLAYDLYAVWIQKSVSSWCDAKGWKYTCNVGCVPRIAWTDCAKPRKNFGHSADIVAARWNW